MFKRGVMLYALILLAGSFIAASAASAESVFLNDGSIIEGKVIKETDKTLSLKPAAGGAVRIFERKNVIRVLYSDDYKKKVYVHTMDDSVIEGYIVYEDRDNYTVRTELNRANETLIPKDKVNFISKKKIEQKQAEPIAVKDETPQPAQDEKPRIFGMDWGVGWNFGFTDQKSLVYNNITIPQFDWLYFLMAMRVNVFFDFRFNITSIFSAGLETGVNLFPNLVNLVILQTESAEFMTYTGVGFNSPFFIDIPFRGFLRLGTKRFYGQVFGGYYLGIFPLVTLGGTDIFERGPEVGGRVNLGGFYLEFTAVFAHINSYRFGLGYTGRMF